MWIDFYNHTILSMFIWFSNVYHSPNQYWVILIYKADNVNYKVFEINGIGTFPQIFNIPYNQILINTVPVIYQGDTYHIILSMIIPAGYPNYSPTVCFINPDRIPFFKFFLLT